MNFVGDIALSHSTTHNAIFQSHYNDIKTLFYSNITESATAYNNNIDKIVSSNSYIDDDNISDLFAIDTKNVFFPDHIQQFIYMYSSIVYQYVFGLHGRTITVKLVYFNDIPSEQDIEKTVKKIYMWLNIITLYADPSCSRQLDVNIYFTTFEKQLPVVEQTIVSDYNTILGSEHVNSAWTQRCKTHNTITIFREEEWFKVLCHESIHTFGLDFEMDKKTTQMCSSVFNVYSDFRINESYCEFWATIWNTMFVAYDKCGNSPSSKQFIANYRELMYAEKQFSIFQMIKVLKSYNMAYDDIYDFDKNRGQFKEHSNVFCYYVIKAIMLFNDTSVIEYLLFTNDNIIGFSNNASSAIKFMMHIKEMLADSVLSDIISKIDKNIRDSKSEGGLHDTLRMTLYG